VYQHGKGVTHLSKVLFVQRRHLVIGAVLAALIVAASAYLRWGAAEAVSGAAGGTRTIHMVTGEFKTTTAEGKEIEAYRWDPGTIFVNRGERVRLSIYGVNGASHPFYIEGLNVRGEVVKGKETTVTFTANKEGTYRIICLSHTDIANSGPMIGYIVVD